MGRVGKDREQSSMPEQSTPAASATTPSREHFALRLGFILISAGCAIGLGNVWRFPYITGQYGGAAFFLIYLVFLVILGLPVMVMEFAVGRASQKSAAQAFDRLQPSGTWHWFSWWGYIGCTVLMMFYTTVCGMGLQKGVERITKWMMATLFVVMLVLCVRAVTLPGAGEGIAFYLVPDFSRLFAGVTPAEQWATFSDAVFAAMGQALFSLSLGMASMEIFGSYIGRERSLAGEAISVTALNTVVAVLAGLIIFPACFAYGVSPDQGPSLVFVTLPVVFGQMPLGNVWGALFFVFMGFAALSTVIAVFENLISWSIDKWGITRRRAATITGVLVLVLSLPCALGFNVLSGVTVPAVGDIQSIEDFIVSNNLLPLGALFFVLFCTTRRGWGWDGFLAEANAGRGVRFPACARLWLKYGIPVLILVIFVLGYAPKIAAWLGLVG